MKERKRVRRPLRKSARMQSGKPAGDIGERVAQAAERVARKYGAGGFTMERIAAEAGLSKGGLLHHFPTKQEILFALVDRAEERLEHACREVSEQDGTCSRVKATIASLLKILERRRNERHDIAELLIDASTRDRFREVRRKKFREMSAGMANPEKAVLAMLLADGVWMDNFIGYSSYPEEARIKAIEDVLRFADSLDGGSAG